MTLTRGFAALTPLDRALAVLLDGLGSVAPVALPLTQALGCVAAEMAPFAALPAFDLAAADGWALRSSDLVGASSWSPLPFEGMCAWVEAGDRMPAGCDCVLARATVEQNGSR